jgi:glyoxylase-like metal-dependent hydrolase (beta-lactamase superfamily II)
LQTTLEGTPVDREVYGGETSPEVMDVLRAILTPGHLSFCQPERQLVFCGDVMVRRLGWLPFAAVTVDEDENKPRSVSWLDTATMCFGHGAPLVRNTALRVRDFAKQVGVE